MLNFVTKLLETEKMKQQLSWNIKLELPNGVNKFNPIDYDWNQSQ